MPGYRVALVLGTSHGGMGAHVRMLAAGLAERGARVAVLGPRATVREIATVLEIDTGRDIDGRRGNGTVLEIDGGRDIGTARGARISFGALEIGERPRPRDAGTLARLRRSLAGADVVHAHGIRAGALCALALTGRRRRPALVVTVHNAPPLAGVVPALAYRALEAVVARRADTVLCVSGDLEARLRAAGARRVGHAVVPSPPAREAGDQATAPVRAVPDRAAAGEAVPDRAVPGEAVPDRAGEGRPVVLGAGRLVPQKGFAILLEAAASWLDMNPRPLVVIAGDGPLAGSLRDQAAALGVDAVVPGHRDDVPALLRAASVFVLPSVWEGQPLVLQEALRAGVPIVATRAGGIPDLTGTTPAGAGGPGDSAPGGGAPEDSAPGNSAPGDGAPEDRAPEDSEAAVLVRPGDGRELAAAVRAVLTDQALAARLRAAALARAAALPSPDEAITAVLAAYADAIGDTRTCR